MGCATKNAKVIAISIGSLQRLIALKAVPQSAAPLIISTMSDCMSQGVDIQLRILQTLLSLITNFPSVHGELLGDVCCISKCNYCKPHHRSPRHYSYVLDFRSPRLRSFHQLPLLPCDNL